MNKTKFVGVILMALCAFSAFAATETKTVTWSLPENWDDQVSYPTVEGYRAIESGGVELRARAGLGKVGEPDLPYYLINIALPENGTFGEVSAEAEWIPLDLDLQSQSLLPFPILEPVPSGSEPSLPALSDAYNTVYPAVVAKKKYLEIVSGVRMMPICVTPYRWDGTTKTLYKAKTLTVTATYTMPKSLLRLTTSSASSSKSTAGHPDLRKMALSMTINPSDATTASSGLRLTTSSADENLSTTVPSAQGDATTADYIILSPHKFVDLWKDYATFRKGTQIGSTHTFAVVDTQEIYSRFTTEHDDALKIHHYLEGIYKLGNIKYILLGAAAKRYNYDPETMIQTRYVVAGGGLNQITDEYYGCMDRLPTDSGVEVWDYDGDGYYMGHRNANGSYTHDNPSYVDFKQDIIVFRFSLMERMVDSGLDLTAAQVIDNFKKKVTHLESDTYANKFDYCLSGSTVFGTVYRGGGGDTRGMTEQTTRERKFFDGNMNVFDPDHSTSASDSELMPRDRHWQFLTYLRGSRKTIQYNSTKSNATYADMYDSSGAVFNIWAHGWQRGCPPGDGAAIMKMKGYYTFFINPIPCSAGCYDYCNGYGITNTISFGESSVLSPHGGLASYANSRLGWVASYKSSCSSGSYSSLIEHYLFQCVSGVTRFQETGKYELMDAGEAHMYAKNNYHDNYSSIIWGLAGVQVEAWGDPLARLPVQHSRLWDGNAGTLNWNTNDANWKIVGGNDHVALDQTCDTFLPLKDGGSKTFTVDGYFTTGGFYVKQDEGATLEIAGTNGTFKVFREAVITNGNLRWTAAGGIGRDGIKFAGTDRGNIILPGDAERYFGDNFVHVGKVAVSGGNVTIDLPKGAQFGDGKALDFEEIEFVATNAEDVTEWNTLRSREPGIFKTDKYLRVVNSKLNLETYKIGGSGAGNKDKPLIYATNSTLRVRPNPRWYEGVREEYFVRPTYLDNSTLEGCYEMFGFGPDETTGYDLYVSGSCKIAGDTDIKLNGELRVHFLGANAELEIANTLCDGLSAGSVTFSGTGTVKVTATQDFTGTMTASSGVTIRCTIPNAISGGLLVENGGKLVLDSIPLAEIKSLTVNAGGGLYLPATTAKGIYQVVDTTTCTIDLKDGYELYDNTKNPPEKITGELTDGYIIQTDNILTWNVTSGTWNKTDTSVWSEGKVYSDGLPLVFGDVGSAETINVTVGENVAPGFMDFKNTIGRYVFSGSPTISLDSLALKTNVSFESPLNVAGSLRVLGGSAEMNDVNSPLVEVADGGTLRINGEATISAQKIRKVRFEFSDTYTSGNRAAIQELRLYTAEGELRLPIGTVIKDIAGQTVNVTGWDSGSSKLILSGHTGDEQLGALVDGIYQSGNNKWWASKSASPTWFEITFPEAVDPLTGYNFCTADSVGRNPKTWIAYTSIDGTHWAKAAQVSNQGWVERRTWMRADNNVFNFINANGFLTAKEGGTLVADGITHLNLEFEAGATLAITNDCCISNVQSYAKLVMPEGDTVKVDLSSAKSSTTAFPIVRGFNITAEQFAKFECVQDTAMLQLKDGDIYAATAGILVPPYTATVSSGDKWSSIDWYDKYNTKFNMGSANIKADGEATLTVNGTVSLVNDVVGTIAKLTVKGSGNLTVSTNGTGVVFEPGVLDDSAHTGTLVWDQPIGSAAVIAGKDTQIGGNAPGAGLLTVAADKKVTLLSGVTFANMAIDKAGWIRYAGTRTLFELEDLPDAIYSFEDTGLTGMYLSQNKTIRSMSGDKAVFESTNISYYARSLLNFDIQGGLVEFDVHGPMMSFGRTGVGSATKFAMSGGTFRCKTEQSETDGGLLLGYEGGTGEGCEINIKPTAGLFEVPNSFVNFFYPTLFHLTGNARLKGKGFISTQNPGTIILGTNATAIATTATLEIGSLGFRANAADILIYGNNKTENSAILGYEDGAYLEQNVTVYTHSSLEYPVTVAATNGTTFTLRDMTFTSARGAEVVVFGNKSKNWDGTIKIGTLASLPPRYKLNAGTLDLGTVGCSDTAKLVSAPENGATVRVVITRDEYESGAAIDVLRCDTWASDKTDAEIRQFLKLYRIDENGNEVAVSGGTLKYLNGLINFIPEGGAGYVFPLSATVTSDTTWTKLSWKDRNGQDYTNDWTKVSSAELVCNGTYTVTMDKAITLEKYLKTVTSSGKKLTIEETTDYTLTVAQVDDSGSAGTTVLHITLGAGAIVKAGKNLELKGAADETTEHGTIQIPSGGTATIRNGLWNGEVEMADSTSQLSFISDTTYTTVPSSIGKATVGTITYYTAMAPSDGIVQFGSDSRAAADGIFNTRNAGFTCKRFITGIGNGTIQKFVFYSSGSTITVTPESDDDEIVLAQDPGSSVTLSTQGAIIAPDALMWLGKGGSASLHMFRDISVKGLVNDQENATSSEFLLYGNTMTIGSEGIDIVSDVTEPFYCSGTIRARESATIHVEPYIGCSNGMKLKADEGVTMTVDAPIASTYRYSSGQPLAVIGPGHVIMAQPVTTKGTVTLTNVVFRLTQPELLNTSKVVFEAGSTMEVVITKSQALATKTIKLYATDATADVAEEKTAMLVEGTLDPVDGTFSKQDGYIYFTPTTFSGAYAATTADGNVNWTALNWHDKSGKAVDPTVWSGTVGTITLSNAYNAVVCFEGSCTVSELILVNEGSLSFSGNGEMATYKIDDSASTGTTTIGAFVKTLGSVISGADTTLTERGDGNVTVASGKRLTIPGWTTPANVQGAGVVALDMGSRDEAVETYWSKDGGVSGTNQIVRGTWTFTAKAQYPGSKHLLVSGTDAVLRLTENTDVTYGAGGSGTLTVEDGGEFQVYKRDTFNRTLYLRNGGKLLMNNDNNDNSGRSFDVFTSATLNVTGEEPSIIGGENATNDSYGNPTVNSGIIAIRRKDFTIDVANGSILKCYSRWNAGDGSSGSFIMTGKGTLEQFRESGNTLPFVVQQGTLRLVNSGTVTTGSITANLGALEVVTSNGYAKTISNSITGTYGGVIKSGGGTLTLSGANNYYALWVKEGTLNLGGSSVMATSSNKIDAGATLNIATYRPSSAMTLNGNLLATVTQSEKEGEQWVTLCTLNDNSSFTLSNLTVYDTDGTTPLTDAETRITDDKKVQIKCQAYKMPIKLDAYSAVSADWTQTSWKDANSTVIPPEKWAGLYGRTNLAVEVYAHNGNAVTLGICTNIEVASLYISDDTGKVTFNRREDYVFTSEATELYGTLQVFGGVDLGALTGDGTLIATNFIPAYTGLTDATKWTGTLRLWDITTDAFNLTQIVNAQSQFVLDGVTVMAAVTIPSEYAVTIAEGSVFTTSGLTVNGTINLTAGDIKPFSGDVTFEANSKLCITMAGYMASIPLTDEGATLSIPNTVQVYINGAQRPAGTWTISDGAINLPLNGPFKATVTESADWTALSWFDSSSTPVPVHPGVWAVSGTPYDVELTVNANATLTANSQVNVGTVKVTGSGTVALPTSNLTMGNIWGDGIVAYASWPTCTGLTDGTKWTGTLKLTGKLDGGGKSLADYGSDKSTIEIAGTLSGYLAKAGSCSSAIVITGTLTFSNGYSGSGGYTFNGALSGNGKITTSGSQSDVINFKGDVSDFVGTVQVGGDHCIAFGDQTDTDKTKGQIVVNKDVTIAAGKQWSTANGIIVRDGKTLTMTSGTTPVSGNVTFEGASTLALTDDGSAESYTIATGTLTLSDTTVIKFGDKTASRTEWFAAGGSLVKPTNITATPEGASLAGHDGQPISVTGVSGGYAVVNTAISPSTLIAKGDALTIKFSDSGTMTLAGGLLADDTAVTLDAGGLDGTELAKNAVCGAPYSHWLVKGPVSGTVDVTNLPSVPTGYEITSQVLEDYGVRLIITAPTAAKLGVISVNLHNGTALSGEGEHGLYPDVLANWGSLKVTANNSTTISNVAFALSGNVTGYGVNNTPPDMIQKQYMDDGYGRTSTITMSNIGYDKYRVIVYYSTDSTTINFQPLVLNDVYYSAIPAGTTEKANTIKGASAFWGNTGPNHNAYAPCEGVNALVSDVMTDTTVVLKAIRGSSDSARATIAAIQIVKVGDTVVITPEKHAWNNPVTGDTQNFDYAFFGTSDANWTTIGNWRKYGSYAWNTITGTAPMLSGSNIWDPTVIDGDQIATEANKTITLSDANMEGWTPRLALFNCVTVTVSKIKKFQGSPKWFWVDATSQLRFGSEGSDSYDGTTALYVAAKDGIVFGADFGNNGNYTTFDYYLSTNGTVKYEAALTKCSHAIKQFCLPLSAPSAYKIIKERTLVTYPSASVNFTTSSIEVPTVGGVTPSNLGRAPTTDDDVGAYGVVKGAEALVVQYVDYSQFYTNLADNAEIAVSTINTLAATAGSEPFHVVFGNGVTVNFDADFASNVVFDFTKMTSDSVFVKTGEGTFVWSNVFESFAGKFDIRNGVMTIPSDTLANALTVSGGTLNLSIDGGLVAGTTYTITSGTMTDITKDDITVNGTAIPAYWKFEDGKLSKIVWTYPLTLSPTDNFTTATAAWKDSSSPAQTYCEGFDGSVTSMQIDGYAMSDVTYWTNDATTLNVGTLSFFYVSAADLHFVNANGCNITANTIDASGLIDYYGDIYLTNEEAIHLEFDTGSAAIKAGTDTWLYGNGSGEITLADGTQLTFAPQAGTNLTYSGSITGTGKLVKDGAGILTLSNAKSFTGDFTVKNGKLALFSSDPNPTEIDLPTSGKLTLPDGATVSDYFTLNGAALPEGNWVIKDGKLCKPRGFSFMIE